MNESINKSIETKIPPQHLSLYNELLSQSDEAILFGSHAMNLQTPTSDLDILFIGGEFDKKIKKKGIDFIQISAEKTHLDSWLGSELANHISRYGMPIKGELNWMNNTFISKYSINRKKIKIISRLSHIYVNKSKKIEAIESFLVDVLLDSFRLMQMMRGRCVPPTILIKFILSNSDRNYFKVLSRKDFLGKIAKAFFIEFDRDFTLNENYINIIKKVRYDLKTLDNSYLLDKLHELEEDIVIYPI